jgi:hypothetical protein
MEIECGHAPLWVNFGLDPRVAAISAQGRKRYAAFNYQRPLWKLELSRTRQATTSTIRGGQLCLGLARLLCVLAPAKTRQWKFRPFGKVCAISAASEGGRDFSREVR